MVKIRVDRFGSGMGLHPLSPLCSELTPFKPGW